MLQKRDAKWGEYVAQFIGVACVAIVMMSIWPGWPWIAGKLSESDAPAWVQAIGSVAAICVAVWIPWRQKQISDIEVKGAEKITAQIAALETIDQLDYLSAGLGVLHQKLIDIREGRSIPSTHVAEFMLDAFESMEIPSDQSIRDLISLRSDVHIYLIQLSVKWRQGFIMLRMNVKFKTEGSALMVAFNNIEVLCENILALSEKCSVQLNAFVEMECGMSRSPSARGDGPGLP